MAPSTLASPAERGSAATGRGSDFAELMRQVRAAGLLERRPGYYLTKIAVTGGLLVAAWAVFVVVGFVDPDETAAVLAIGEDLH